MTSAQHQLWIDRGKPFRMSRPVAAVTAKMRAHGFTVGTIGNDAHLDAQPPEDHAPFSETGWPIASPYGTCNAGDLMPAGGPVDWREVMHQMYLDRQAGVPGTEWIKFMNRELPDTKTCVQDSWKPGHVRRSSSDRGHGHFSGRSDMTNATMADDYDPVARAIVRLGGTVTPQQESEVLAAARAFNQMVAGSMPAGAMLAWRIRDDQAWENSKLILANQARPVVVTLAPEQLAALGETIAANLDDVYTLDDIQAATERGVKRVLREGTAAD